MRCFLILTLAIASGANDGTMTMGIARLVPLQSTAVRLEREELQISASEIRVRYWFRNVTQSMVRVRVGFSLPRVDRGNLANRLVRIPARERTLVDFRARVDGVERKAELEIGALDRELPEALRQDC